MSLSDYIGRIVDFVDRLPKNWRSKQGVVHAMTVHTMRQEHEVPEAAIADFWATLCESDSWEEKCPKLTTAKVNCIECLGHEDSPS